MWFFIMLAFHLPSRWFVGLLASFKSSVTFWFLEKYSTTLLQRISTKVVDAPVFPQWCSPFSTKCLPLKGLHGWVQPPKQKGLMEHKSLMSRRVKWSPGTLTHVSLLSVRRKHCHKFRGRLRVMWAHSSARGTENGEACADEGHLLLAAG